MNSLNVKFISRRPLDYKICPFTSCNKHLLLNVKEILMIVVSSSEYCYRDQYRPLSGAALASGFRLHLIVLVSFQEVHEVGVHEDLILFCQKV